MTVDLEANTFNIALTMQRVAPSCFLWPLLTFNILLLLCNLWQWSYNAQGEVQLSVQTLSMKFNLYAEPLYLENNYPIELPLSFDMVGMTLLKNTTHFQMDLKDHISRLEWTTLSDHPFVVHIGSDGRAFQVALFHQLHCIHVMEEAFLRGEYHGLNSHHIQHCENYLRQSFLCMADDSIEEGDFMHTWSFADRNMGSKVCRDWTGVSAAVKENLRDWLEQNRSRML